MTERAIHSKASHATNRKIGNLQRTEANLVVFNVRPRLEIEVAEHVLAVQRRTDVQKVGNPFHKRTSQDQNDNSGMEPQRLGNASGLGLVQDVDQLKHGETKYEPGKRRNDSSGNEVGLVVDQVEPSRFECRDFEAGVALPAVVATPFRTKGSRRRGGQRGCK
eukprot:CAMPEP_0116144746 /NCGR_PEP_ID=MMETSP0329-20121206/16183_1 /TAXON_ID=697910 /ORGANISM="Pseudo-nitzschia arenysensis, Strain B593" /LENGTH=162 /DNA_ID=CAMNT_0003640223 /DNA_START=84 /DNA_END=572 /DNA_ORIENTATION=-